MKVMRRKLKVSRISISLHPDLLKKFDELVKEMGYDRSKAVQAAMRDFIAEQTSRKEKGMGAGALIMVYDHEVRDAVEKLMDIQHRYSEIIESSSHTHLDERHCLEMIAVRGDLKKIRSLEKELMSARGVRQLKFVPVSP